MKISLHLNGRKMIFSKEELLDKLRRLDVLEKHIANEAMVEEKVYEIVQKPTDGKYFMVNPSTIIRDLFKQKKIDVIQEWTRKCIIQALSEARRNPRKYMKPFLTFIPNKNWKSKTVFELKSIASTQGDHIADWVEQALEWAQRITNGESWEELCNFPDTLNWYRLVVWKNNYTKIVGGSSMCGDSLSSCIVFGNQIYFNDTLNFTVPLVILYP